MEQEERKYYPYVYITRFINIDLDELTRFLYQLQIFEVNKNPATGSMYGKTTVCETFRRKEKELFELYFKDFFLFEDGTERYVLGITDEFIEFVKDKIEKVGDIYNVHFK